MNHDDDPRSRSTLGVRRRCCTDDASNDEGLVEEHTLESIWSKEPEAHLAKYSDYPRSLGK
jgi:hypothetical protein